ncbi:MAG: hypothetical protein ACI4V5_08085 [Prevotella sp.]
MKKNLIILSAITLATMTVSACGNKTQSANDNVDTTAVDSTAAAAADENAADEDNSLVLTSAGVGAIKLGMAFSDVPKSIDGLYTSKEEVSNDDFEGVFLNNSEGNSVISLEGSGKVETINVDGGDIKTAEGIYVGMPAKEVRSMKGAKKVETDPYADYQVEEYIINGVRVSIDSYVDKGDIVSRMSVSK